MPAAMMPAAADTGWRRLDPRMLLVHPVREVGRAFPVLITLLLFGRTSGHAELWGLFGVVLIVILGLLRWATTSFRVTGDQVQIRRGLLRRSEMSVPRDRVRTVDVTAHFLHRMLGLARVAIGTGLSDRRNEHGLVLDALRATQASALRDELLHRGQSRAGAVPGGMATDVPMPAAASEVTLLAFRPSWIGYGPFTLSGLVTIGVVVGFGWRLLNQAQVDPLRLGPLREVWTALSGQPAAVAAAEVGLATVLAVAVCSAAGYALAYWNFTLTRTSAGTLHISRGLLTTRQTTIEERRLRGVEMSQPLLLQAVHAARCLAITTGLRVGRGAERGGTVLAPPIPLGLAEQAGARVLGTDEPLRTTLTRHGPRARRRRYLRALAAALLLVAAAVAMWRWLGLPAWLALASLVALPIAAWLAHGRYRNLGHALCGRFLVIGAGALVRRRYVLERDGIIGWSLHQSFFQRRAGLATLVATTAAGRQGYEIVDMPAALAVAVADRTTAHLLTPFTQP
jgi:putative membrane protein